MNKKPDDFQVSETQRYAMVGVAFGFLFPVMSTIIRVLLSNLPLNFSNAFLVQRSDPLLWVIDTAPLFLGLFAAYGGYHADRASRINKELRERDNELQTHQVNLEQYVTDRTAELALANQRNQRRAAQFESIARISRTISSTRTLDALLPQIVETISGLFGFYHVAIYLLDTRKEYAVLVAANSAGGKRMLERNHRVLVRATSVVSFVTNTGQPRVALDVGKDAVYFNSPDLPDTHSEIALPLHIGNDIFGALDAQSIESNAFSEEDLNVLSTLADQVSIAIQNARAYQQTSEALAQADAASVQLSGRQWRQYLADSPVEGFYFDGVDAKDLKPSDKQRPHSLAIPLTLRGTQVGVLKLNAIDSDRVWTDDEIAIAQAAAERTTLALENARLLQEAQKRAAKERTIGQISAKIGSLVNLENILQTTIQELGNTLPGTDVAIQFTSENSGQLR